jgi:lipooligosaccharide transport system ATP-binding protein
MRSDAPLALARGLIKRFGDFTAVDGIDFEVHRGEAFGFLGPNGAGKTSAMRMLGCTSSADGGHLEVFGLDPATNGPAIRARLGVVAQEDNLDTDLTVEENLLIYGRYFGLDRRILRERVERLLAFAQLSDRRHDRVDPLSGGMKRRLVISRALLNEPELVLLDEPTTGLDPQARHLLWERLWSLKSQGVSLVITTHYMDEAEQLCDRLVIMDRGRIVDEGAPGELIRRHCPREVVEVRYADAEHKARGEATAVGLGLRTEALPDRLLVYTDDGDALVPVLDGDPGHRMALSVLVRRASLEDVFLTLTGRSLED